MQTFYFNTGVKPYNVGKLYEGDKFINNELHIPFNIDNVLPETAKLMFLCNDSNIYSDNKNIIVCEVLNSRMSSKYVYFRI